MHTRHSLRSCDFFEKKKIFNEFLRSLLYKSFPILYTVIYPIQVLCSERRVLGSSIK